jgi:hypothetical protein
VLQFASHATLSCLCHALTTRRYYGFQIRLVFDETTGLSDIEIYDCNNGEAVVESENGGLEQRLSSGAGASGDCLSQVHLGGSFGWDQS